MTVENHRLSEALATKGALSGIGAFLGRITKAVKAKGLTLAKLVRIYTAIEKAVKEVEAIVAEK